VEWEEKEGTYRARSRRSKREDGQISRVGVGIGGIGGREAGKMQRERRGWH
jgi:hypothetical protein